MATGEKIWVLVMSVGWGIAMGILWQKGYDYLAIGFLSWLIYLGLDCIILRIKD